MSILDTGIKNVRNVSQYIIGRGALSSLPDALSKFRGSNSGQAVFFVDDFFKNNPSISEKIKTHPSDIIIYVPTVDEPTTLTIDALKVDLLSKVNVLPSVIIGMGGGTTMDIAKAVSNLLTNDGLAQDYQGWDLLKFPGVYKIAIPTISGTGAEATRTCVMTNKKTGLKLGMNSDFTVYNQIIMDPDLTATVPRPQYFYTGMDAYIHCVEALAGSYRNAIGDAYSRETINLCRQVFLSSDMMSPENRERLMVASYLGGSAIATSYVGLIHPFSAGLSVVLGLHHCVANCIVMNAMHEYYPKECDEFSRMLECQNIEIPKHVCRNLSEKQYKELFESTIIHHKPLTNALGLNYRSLLTEEVVISIFKKM